MNKESSKVQEIAPQEIIKSKIFFMRGTLNQAVKRNIRRFPDDFMFKMTK
jgi:hypothetical protein